MQIKAKTEAPGHATPTASAAAAKQPPNHRMMAVRATPALPG